MLEVEYGTTYPGQECFVSAGCGCLEATYETIVDGERWPLCSFHAHKALNCASLAELFSE